MLASEHVMAHTYTYTSYVLHAYSYTTISFKFIESFFYIAKICKQKPDLVGKLIWCLKFISFTWYIVCCVCVAALRVRLYMCEGILSACHNSGSPTHTHTSTHARASTHIISATTFVFKNAQSFDYNHKIPSYWQLIFYWCSSSYKSAYADCYDLLIPLH